MTHLLSVALAATLAAAAGQAGAQTIHMTNGQVYERLTNRDLKIVAGLATEWQQNSPR